MKKIMVPLLVYLIVCIIAVMLPASDEYNTIGWKLLIGQIYAIPVLIIACLISFFLHKRLSHKYEKINEQ
ncbi:hypothetical protein B857_02662 [Solibacillus isronensis B3W22]|uniref:DUF4017 domain-containing protein n=1 Tax=Solibacillus isronensis B3W22 TaxID=1224748 RepID=K1KKF2_9BACL|nr:DUF4017 family protein [Solibacillus isronensis]AMO85408.1 hypothetical protein SOLI23_07380 [Solibacillus silvestris]EKB44560.1 hypothetical protein B857_02662 [Solibacillus isronensis B3W22]